MKTIQIIAVLIAVVWSVSAGFSEQIAHRGKGLRITVPSPVARGLSASDDWAAQVVQDLLTQGLSEYTDMTVIDRANEALVLEEQKRSEKNSYSDTDYLELGKITQAQYLLVGSITNAGGVYRLSLSVNDGVTNEVKAAFNEAVSLEDIQNGNATNAALLKLLGALGFSLTEGEKAKLMHKATDSARTASTVNLAKGMAAEARANTVEAMAYYAESDTREASVRLGNIKSPLPTGSTSADIKNDIEARISWVKAYEELQSFANTNAIALFYDALHGESKTDYSTETVTIPFAYSYAVSSALMMIYRQLESGLDATGMREKWRVSRTDFSISIPEYRVTFALKSASGALLGKETELLSSGKLESLLEKGSKEKISGEVVFSRIPYQNITDSFSFGIEKIEVYSGRKLLAVNPPISVNGLGGSSLASGMVDALYAADAIRELKEPAEIKITGTITKEIAKEIGNAATECKTELSLDLSDAVIEEKYLGQCMLFGAIAPWSCPALVSITLPAADYYSLPYFDSCPNLRAINIVENEQFVSIDNVIYHKDFAGRGTLHSVWCVPKGIEEFAIPDGVKCIWLYAFSGCKKLKSITIPLSVKEIYEGAFSGCFRLSDVKYEGTAKQWKKIKINKSRNSSLLDAAKKSIK